MHILILSGNGDIRQYIWNQGIGLKFYKCNSMDNIHHRQFEDELKIIEKDAYIHLKGICFPTQRYETIKIIYDYFKDKENKIEFLRIDKSGNVVVYIEDELRFALLNNWEIR
jgi:hypothetical protein